MGKVINFFEAVEKLKKKKVIYITSSSDFKIDFCNFPCYNILPNDEDILIRPRQLKLVED